jgi:hypothetical protein
VEAGEVHEVYQDDELPSSFSIDPNSTLESLLDDANGVTVLRKGNNRLIRQRNVRYLTFMIIDIMFFLFYITFLIFDIMFLLHTHLCLFSTGC